MADMLINHVKWETHPVPSTAAVGSIQVSIGGVGSGTPVGLLTASVHGDEGPWGTRAIRKLLETTPIGDLKGSLRIVPVANPMAVEANSRTSSLDALDVSASFPAAAQSAH